MDGHGGSEEGVTMSSFLSWWTGRPEQGETFLENVEQGQPEPLPAPKRRSQALTWAASPALERVQRELDEQVRTIEEAKRLLEERLSPLQRHLWEQRRNVDQALKLLEARIKPLRQYIAGEESNLQRVGTVLKTELTDQFEAFEKILTEQRQILERAQRYLEEQPRPLAQFLEDQQRAIEHVFHDVEEKFEPFGRYLKEQQKLIEALAEPRLTEEFDTLAGYCGERQAALERYATAAEYRPQVLFAELDDIYQKYKMQDAGKSKLLGRVLEQTRQADLRLQDALRPLPREEPRPPRIEAAP
jgi:predicted  nucleic acid-binding Zn-ribbon protein